MSSYLPRPYQFKPSEGSRLHSPRDRNALPQAWKGQLEANRTTDKLVSEVSQLRRQVAALSRRGTGSDGMHPFKIYQFPQHLRVYKNDDDWRRFKVRGGSVCRNGTFFSGVGTPGSDLAQNYIQSDAYSDVYFDGLLETPPASSALVNSTWHEFLAPIDGSDISVWYTVCLKGQGTGSPTGLVTIDGDGTTKRLENGETVTIPVPDTGRDMQGHYNRWIGEITYLNDPIFGVFQSQFSITQFVNEPALWFPKAGVINPQMNFLGDYSATQWYYCGDVVQVTETVTGGTWRSNYILMPETDGDYDFQVYGPVKGIAPSTDDPWQLFSKYPIDAEYTTGAYNSAKYYLRTT